MEEDYRRIQNIFYTMGPAYEDFLRAKYDRMEVEEQRWESTAVEDAELVLVAFGISSRVCEEAVEGARAKGLKVGLIRPITLYPFPVKAFEEAKNAKAFMTVEMNLLGQMTDDVRLATGCELPVYHYGSIFSISDTQELIARAEELIKEAKGGEL
jgi:2-oxoglutarate ferredoxin oxidoreductase subunit alpha